jgi:hypothetical protein
MVILRSYLSVMPLVAVPSVSAPGVCAYRATKPLFEALSLSSLQGTSST